MTRHEFADEVGVFFPYDGPHSVDTVLDAAAGLSALVRYLNNATGPGNGRETLAWANTTHELLGGVEAAVYGLDQLFGQLAAAMERLENDPTLYDDRGDRPAADTAALVAARLRDVREWSGELAGQVGAARELSVHLGNR